MEAEILEVMPGGTRKVKFNYNGIFNEILDKIGLMPLPPYIHEELKQKDRYQTIYAKYEGSAAAPTAGLHGIPDERGQLCAAAVQGAAREPVRNKGANHRGGPHLFP